MSVLETSNFFALLASNGTNTYTFNITRSAEDVIFVYLYNETTGNWEKVNETEYTITGNTLTFNTIPTQKVYIRRITNRGTNVVDNFQPGSSIRGEDLDKNFLQLLNAVQENENNVSIFFPGILADLNANNHHIRNLADGSSDDMAVNRKQLGDIISSDITANNNQGIEVTKTQSGTNSGDELVISGIDSSKTTKGVVSIDEGHAIGVAYTNGDAVISADKSTASQQGVVKISAPTGTDGNPIALSRPADGELEIDLNTVITSQYSSNWTGNDGQVATVGALAARLDAVISTSQPTTTQVGKFWYNPTESINALYIWTGSTWKVLTTGTPYIPLGTSLVRYVDAVNGSDDIDNLGFLPQSPLKTIKRALTLINASANGDGTLVVLEPGVYQEDLPLTIEKNNISVVGKSMRSCFIHPTVATENNNMWEVDSGTYLSNLTMLGLKVPTSDQSSRNNTLDNDATYGLPSNQPFAVSFRSGNPVILKSPYVQNCTHFSDAHFDNANFDPETFSSTDAQTYSAVAGDETSAPCGGGVLVDGSVPASTSPIRSIVVDAFTQITLDGPGVLVTNNGYAQLVSFFGTFCHYHAKAKNGGQINLSNCVSDFGRYGLIADGHGDTFATATASAANSGATVVTVGALTTTSGHHVTATEPLNHMMITIDGNDYGVVGSTANGSGWDVTITPALSQNISSNAVSFSLRSYISTGGHTFEYVGVGTNYGDHPDKGGKAIEANQSIELNGGKVWLSSTDHIGKFKAGSSLIVDSVLETVALKDTTITGNLTISGNVDGRDVNADGLKLDGIDANATNYGNTNVNTLLTTDANSNGKVLSYDSSSNAYAWVAQSGGITNISDDLTPSLGGDLDVDGNDIVSTSNGDIELAPHGTGRVVFKGNTTNGSGQLKLNCENNSHGVIIKGPAHTASANYTLTLPTTDGGSNEFLKTDGSGNLSWAAAATDIDSLTDGRVIDSSIGVGSSTASGSTDTALGDEDANATSHGNTIFGMDAGLKIGSVTVGGTPQYGYNNTGFGSGALNKTINGHSNSFFGANAGFNIGDTSNNSGFGSDALKENTTGSANTAVGQDAIGNNTTGYGNTAVGQKAAMGASIAGVNARTCIGAEAGQKVGENSTYIGYKSGLDQSSNRTAPNQHDVGTNNIVIGANATTEAYNTINQIVIGDASNQQTLRMPGFTYGASDGQVLTYEHSSGNIVLTTPSSGSSGAMVKLSTTTVSSAVSQIDFDLSTLASGTSYSYFLIRCDGVTKSAYDSNNVWDLTFYDGTYSSSSPTTNVTGFYGMRIFHGVGGNSPATSNIEFDPSSSTATDDIKFTLSNNIFGSFVSLSDIFYSLNLEIGVGTNSSIDAYGMRSEQDDTFGNPYWYHLGGACTNSSNNLTYVVVKPYSGNINSGTFNVYGVI